MNKKNRLSFSSLSIEEKKEQAMKEVPQVDKLAVTQSNSAHPPQKSGE